MNRCRVELTRRRARKSIVRFGEASPSATFRRPLLQVTGGIIVGTAIVSTAASLI